MYTIYDYINYYKETSYENTRLNIMDQLIFSILVYLPLKSFNEEKTIYELNDFVKEIDKDSLTGLMSPKSIEIYNLLFDSKRYKDIKVNNFVNVRNNDTQFGAMTLRINNKTIISYKGTDGSLIGWIENLRLAYEFPTYTQTLAKDYLKANITFKDKDIYICGDSKGGNLAMYSALDISKRYFKKINKIYNFDGPGFTEEVYKTKEFTELNKKVVNIMPTGSIVGTLMNNNNYQVIKTNTHAFSEHYPTTWLVFGEYFVNGELSSISNQIHDLTTIGIKDLDKDMLHDTFETLFKTLDMNYSEKININFNNVLNIYRNMKDIDPKIKEYIDTIINTIIKSTKVEK